MLYLTGLLSPSFMYECHCNACLRWQDMSGPLLRILPDCVLSEICIDTTVPTLCHFSIMSLLVSGGKAVHFMPSAFHGPKFPVTSTCYHVLFTQNCWDMKTCSIGHAPINMPVAVQCTFSHAEEVKLSTQCWCSHAMQHCSPFCSSA